jgi:hypothetical protein
MRGRYPDSPQRPDACASGAAPHSGGTVQESHLLPRAVLAWMDCERATLTKSPRDVNRRRARDEVCSELTQVLESRTESPAFR